MVILLSKYSLLHESNYKLLTKCYRRYCKRNSLLVRVSVGICYVGCNLMGSLKETTLVNCIAKVGCISRTYAVGQRKTMLRSLNEVNSDEGIMVIGNIILYKKEVIPDEGIISKSMD